jgi:prophage regulatory protein
MRVIRLAELKNKVGWSEQNIQRKIRAGLFPEPIHLGNNTVGWIEAEIDDWIKARIKERDNPSPETLAARKAFSARARRANTASIEAKIEAKRKRLSNKP